MTTLLRYNPALLADEDLVASFVVREPELRQLLDAVRASADAPANQHLLVLGQRGMGKTTLVRRLALAVRESPDLSGRWFPLSFGEEAYEVATAGQLWWQALAHLGQQTGDARWLRVHEELRAEPDDRRLHDRALSALLDFADARGQRLLLVVENLHMLLDEQLSPDEAWVLRKTLQTEPRVLLLATATGRFGAIEDQGQALYGLFRPFPLRPLDLEGCRRVWQAVAGVELAPTRARAVEILTGGNPRLLAILAAFAGGRSLRALMTDLVRVVDEHTTYFKACLESLPAQERRVFVALADLWTPSPASAVAERARVDVNAASALLSRLVSRGAVEVESQEGRRKYYQVAERLYNVYYLLRRAGRADARVEATVRLMTHLYEPERAGRELARAADLRALPGAALRARAAASWAAGLHAEALSALTGSRRAQAPIEEDRGWEVDLLVDAAAAGLASEALAVLEGAPDDPFLAPVAVALRMDLGLPHRAPREHLELARDLAQRIDARRRALTAPTAPASPPEAR